MYLFEVIEDRGECCFRLEYVLTSFDDEEISTTVD